MVSQRTRGTLRSFHISLGEDSMYVTAIPLSLLFLADNQLLVWALPDEQIASETLSITASEMHVAPRIS